MNRRCNVPLPVALVLAGLAPAGWMLAPQDAPRAGSGKVAFVDLHRVFQADAQLKDDLGNIEKRKVEAEAKLNEMKAAYNELRSQAELLEPQGGDKYVEARARQAAKEAEMKQYAASTQAWLDREVAERNLKALERYQKAIAQLAASRGIDVVLRLMVADDSESLGARMQAAERGMVLYGHKSLDITGDVIDLLKAK
ncbi:MAG TPA: OmpH family outer membrane protein [Planctomycetota bacterium]|nr:OmpH family outer membrane protein [Planctomycetota bacterium]